jgi:hypothetical protein
MSLIRLSSRWPHEPCVPRLRCGNECQRRRDSVVDIALTSQVVIGPLLETDHIIPISRGGTGEEENLTLVCPLCNSHQADRVEAKDPEPDVICPLFNPRRDVWNEHFEWVDEGTRVQGRTPLVVRRCCCLR